MTPNGEHIWAFRGTTYGELVNHYVISEEICKVPATVFLCRDVFVAQNIQLQNILCFLLYDITFYYALS
jgi:hypothetical protein